jgi:hypothetical protein
MSITAIIAFFLTVMDLNTQPQQPYIWIHYEKDGKTVLSAGKVNSIAQLLEDLKCED